MSRYKIIRSLYRGRSTEIFHGVIVHPQGLGSEIAVKRLHPELCRDASKVRAFLNEARVGVALHHSNVVDILRASSDPGEPEFIMQYLHGWTLSSLLSSIRVRKKPLELEVALAICHALACGVAHMHERGLVHRHITPSNVMLTSDGCVKIIDFGGAIHSNKKKPASRYTAPEFFRDKRESDARGDIYSIGAIIYELSTGHVLFSGEGHPVDKILRGDYTSPTRCRKDYPGLLAAIVKRCMNLSAKLRYPDVEALLESLENFAADMRFTLSPRVVRSYTQMHLESPVLLDKSRLKTVDDEVTELAQVAYVDEESATLSISSSSSHTMASGPPPVPRKLPDNVLPFEGEGPTLKLAIG
jgi:serine/threonine protein kinase